MCTGAEAIPLAEAATGASSASKGAGAVAGLGSEALAAAGSGAPEVAGIGSEALAVSGSGATPALQGPPVAPAAGGAGITGADVLSTVKTLAPAVSAGASLIGAGAAASGAKAVAAAAKGAVTPPTAMPQPAVDPDIAAIRKKNALLFGADATDLSGGASTPTVGRSLLLGGSSRLGA